MYYEIRQNFKYTITKTCMYVNVQYVNLPQDFSMIVLYNAPLSLLLLLFGKMHLNNALKMNLTFIPLICSF